MAFKMIFKYHAGRETLLGLIIKREKCLLNNIIYFFSHPKRTWFRPCCRRWIQEYLFSFDWNMLISQEFPFDIYEEDTFMMNNFSDSGFNQSDNRPLSKMMMLPFVVTFLVTKLRERFERQNCHHDIFISSICQSSTPYPEYPPKSSPHPHPPTWYCALHNHVAKHVLLFSKFARLCMRKIAHAHQRKCSFSGAKSNQQATGLDA